MFFDMAPTAEERLRVARLYQRLAFGPRPGEFAQGLKMGSAALARQLLAPSPGDVGIKAVGTPVITDLGPFPDIRSAARAAFVLNLVSQRVTLQMWWLDRMACAINPIEERMTWFWHGHWATSISKVEYALPMYKQYVTMRENALGSFVNMSQSMVNDGALQFWLDGGQNTVKSPNENLGRELMELFTLGVGNYTEDDVKASARALTGMKVVRSSGITTYKTKNHDSGLMKILGKNANYNYSSLTEHLVKQPRCAEFIAERLWFRFLSTGQPTSELKNITASLGSTLDIGNAMRALVNSSAFGNVSNEQVRAPVDWFVGATRALKIVPSGFSTNQKLLRLLMALGQVPFDPPSVGGWPADEAWLTLGNAQARITLAQALVKSGSLTPISTLAAKDRVSGIADLFGLARMSDRTAAALDAVKNDVPNMVALALISPECVVSL